MPLTARLSEANIESILAEIENLYRDHSRNGMLHGSKPSNAEGRCHDGLDQLGPADDLIKVKSTRLICGLVRDARRRAASYHRARVW